MSAARGCALLLLAGVTGFSMRARAQCGIVDYDGPGPSGSGQYSQCGGGGGGGTQWTPPATQPAGCPFGDTDCGGGTCCFPGEVCVEGGQKCCPGSHPYDCGNNECGVDSSSCLTCPANYPNYCGNDQCCPANQPLCCPHGCTDEAHPICCSNSNNACDGAHPFCCADGVSCAVDEDHCPTGCPEGFVASVEDSARCCPAGMNHLCNDDSCDPTPNCHGVGKKGTPDPRNQAPAQSSSGGSGGAVGGIGVCGPPPGGCSAVGSVMRNDQYHPGGCCGPPDTCNNGGQGTVLTCADDCGMTYYEIGSQTYGPCKAGDLACLQSVTQQLNAVAPNGGCK